MLMSRVSFEFETCLICISAGKRLWSSFLSDSLYTYICVYICVFVCSKMLRMMYSDAAFDACNNATYT